MVDLSKITCSDPVFEVRERAKVVKGLVSRSLKEVPEKVLEKIHTGNAHVKLMKRKQSLEGKIDVQEYYGTSKKLSRYKDELEKIDKALKAMKEEAETFVIFC